MQELKITNKSSAAEAAETQHSGAAAEVEAAGGESTEASAAEAAGDARVVCDFSQLTWLCRVSYVVTVVGDDGAVANK